MSYRSHAEAFLNTFDHDGAIRAAFDRRYRAQAEAMRSLAAPYLAPAGAAASGAAEGWLALLEDLHPRIMRGVTTGRIQPPGDYPARAAAVGRSRVYGGDRRPSRFHELAGRNPTSLAYARTPGSLARRFLINLVYHAVLQLGVTPLQKFLACHLVANAIDDLTGTSWQAVFATGAADA
jgi:hypothetical protein